MSWQLRVVIAAVLITTGYACYRWPIPAGSVVALFALIEFGEQVIGPNA